MLSISYLPIVYSTEEINLIGVSFTNSYKPFCYIYVSSMKKLILWMEICYPIIETKGRVLNLFKAHEITKSSENHWHCSGVFIVDCDIDFHYSNQRITTTKVSIMYNQWSKANNSRRTRHTSKMELLVKHFNKFRPLTIFTKSSIWDITAF